MLSAILRAPFARPLLLGSVSRFAKPAAIARPLLFIEAGRTFLTTASVASTEAKATKEKKPATKEKKPTTKKKPTSSKKAKAPKAKKAVKAEKAPKVKKVKVDKPKEPKIYKKDLKIPHKRPLSSWQNFYMQYIEEHKKEGDAFGAHAADASAVWKTMSAEEKAKYDASKEEREEYKKLAAEHRSTSETYKKARRTLLKRRTRNVPVGSYTLFVKENYDRSSPLSFLEQGAELAKQWHAKTPEEKEEYKKRSIEIFEQQKTAQAAVETAVNAGAETEK